jgi:hypothetical protein
LEPELPVAAMVSEKPEATVSDVPVFAGEKA